MVGVADEGGRPNRSRDLSFWNRQYRRRADVALETETAFAEICALRSKVLDVLQSRLASISGKEFTYDHRHHLVAQFILGLDLSYAAISQGLYAQAANLQKQQIETLAAIKECEKDRRKEGKTPNVGNSIPTMHQEYNNLNDVAHPAKEDVIYHLTSYDIGENKMVSGFPIFRPDISWAMLVNHCHYLFGLFIGMQNLLEPDPQPQLSDDEKAVLALWQKFKVLKKRRP